MSGDFFGDAVNVAARLLDHAGDNETLATADVVERPRRLGTVALSQPRPMQLRGRVEPVHVHLLDVRRFGDTAATAYGDMLTPARRARRHPPGLARPEPHLRRHEPAGRARPQPAGDLHHRRHPRLALACRIDWHGGTFQLVDLSYNGTYVRFEHDPEIISLRRGACTLHGSGVIGLGAPPTEPISPCVRFEIMQFADTQRQAPLEFGIKSVRPAMTLRARAGPRARDRRRPPPSLLCNLGTPEAPTPRGVAPLPAPSS